MRPALLLLSLVPSVALAAPAERVFLLVLDGLRSQEGVDAEDENLPWLWNTYLPQGVLVRGLENRDATITEPIHRMILTGRRQPTSNFPWYEGRDTQRALSPTLFEELGRGLDLGPEAGWVIGNTVFMDSQGMSLYPGLGQVGAVEATTQEVSFWSDEEIVDLTLEQMGDARLVLVNFHQFDKDAHSGKWEAYIQGIQDADALIDELAQEVGTEDDAFLVLADHGRHCLDWTGHGDTCDCCRDVFVMGWGAGLRSGGEVVDELYELEDLAPTVASLLGIEVPHARGHVIDVLLEEPPLPQDPEQRLADPQLSAEDGVVHLVAQRLPTPEQERAVVSRTSTDGGQTWSEWAEAPDLQGTSSPEEPRVATGGGVVWRSWRAWVPDERSWGLVAQHSLDQGATWDQPARVGGGVLYCASPSLGVDPSTGEAHGLHSDQVTGRTDPATDFQWTWGQEEDWTRVLVSGNDLLHMATATDTVYTAQGPVTLFSAVRDVDYSGANENREVYSASGYAQGSLRLVAVSDSPGLSYWPSAVVDSQGQLQVAWAERGEDLDGEGWSVWIATSSDGGSSFTEPRRLSAGSGEAWRPDLVATPVGLFAGWIEVEGATHRAVWAQVQGDAVTEPMVLDTRDQDMGRISGTWDASTGALVWAWDVAASTHEVHTSREVVGQPDLVLAPSTVDFGSVASGDSLVLDVTLTNRGSAPVQSLVVSVEGQAFSLASAPSSLAVGAEDTVQVIFQPPERGEWEGSLVVDWGDDRLSASLAGQTARACGCTSGSLGIPWLVLPLLFTARRRRSSLIDRRSPPQSLP